MVLSCYLGCVVETLVVFLQAEDGIRDLVRSRGLGDVYKRQPLNNAPLAGLFYGCWRPADSAGRLQLECNSLGQGLSLIHI